MFADPMRLMSEFYLRSMNTMSELSFMRSNTTWLARYDHND